MSHVTYGRRVLQQVTLSQSSRRLSSLDRVRASAALGFLLLNSWVPATLGTATFSEPQNLQAGETAGTFYCFRFSTLKHESCLSFRRMMMASSSLGKSAV